MITLDLLTRAIGKTTMLEDDYIGINFFRDLAEIHQLNITHALIGLISDEQLADIADDLNVKVGLIKGADYAEFLHIIGVFFEASINDILRILTDEFNENQKIGE